MAGCIIGCYGPQRSGKTLVSYLISSLFTKGNINVYTNMSVDDNNFIQIQALKDIPLDKKPKILLLDEAYYFMDSRTWKDNTQSTIFFNTIGKQNILLIITAVHPDTIEKRVRDQHNYMFIVKSDKNFIYYRMFDCIRGISKDFYIKKTQELFNNLKYDTLQVPDWIDCNLADFNQKPKIINNNKINFGGIQL